MKLFLCICFISNVIPILACQNRPIQQTATPGWELISPEESLETTHQIALQRRIHLNRMFPSLPLPQQADLENLQASLDSRRKVEEMPSIQHLLSAQELLCQSKLTTVFCIARRRDYQDLFNPEIYLSGIRFIQELYPEKIAKDQVAQIIENETTILRSYLQRGKPIPTLQQAQEHYLISNEIADETNTSTTMPSFLSTAISWFTHSK